MQLLVEVCNLWYFFLEVLYVCNSYSSLSFPLCIWDSYFTVNSSLQNSHLDVLKYEVILAWLREKLKRMYQPLDDASVLIC